MNVLDDGSPGPRRARVEIIPLIDVIFFLLATFVLFTLTLHRIRVVDAELPQAGEKGGIDETTAFIQASVDGSFHWKVGTTGISETITAAELGPRLQDYKRTVKVPRVMVRSDGAAKLRAAVLVLDEVRRAEITQVAIETLPSQVGS